MISLTIFLFFLQVRCLKLSAPASATVGQPFTVTWTRDKGTDPQSFNLLSGKSFKDSNFENHGGVQSGSEKTGTVLITIQEKGQIFVGAFGPNSGIKLFGIQLPGLLAHSDTIQVGAASSPTTPGGPPNTPSHPGTSPPPLPQSTVSSASTGNTLSTKASTSASAGSSSTGTETGIGSSRTISSVPTPAIGLSGSSSHLIGSSTTYTTGPSGDAKSLSPSSTANVNAPLTPHSRTPIIVGAVLGTLFLLLLLLLIILLRRRARGRRTPIFFGEKMVRDHHSPPWLHAMLAKQKMESIDDDGSTVSIETMSTSPDLDSEESLPKKYGPPPSATESNTVETVVSISTDTPSSLPPGFSYPTIITTPASPEPTILYAPKTVSRKPIPRDGPLSS